jgi:GDP-mannose 6-dehydrogenase
VRVFDAEVMMSRVFGRNKEYIDRTIPHITSLMTESLDDLIAESEVLVIGKRFDGFDVALQRARVDEQIVVDLARVWPGTVSQVAERPVVRIN